MMTRTGPSHDPWLNPSREHLQLLPETSSGPAVPGQRNVPDVLSRNGSGTFHGGLSSRGTAPRFLPRTWQGQVMGTEDSARLATELLLEAPPSRSPVAAIFPGSPGFIQNQAPPTAPSGGTRGAVHAAGKDHLLVCFGSFDDFTFVESELLWSGKQHIPPIPSTGRRLASCEANTDTCQTGGGQRFPPSPPSGLLVRRPPPCSLQDLGLRSHLNVCREHTRQHNQRLFRTPFLHRAPLFACTAGHGLCHGPGAFPGEPCPFRNFLREDSILEHVHLGQETGWF